MRSMENIRIIKDVVAAGGGLAGVCAAIAAARHGASVALVQDRPALGGNSSSEIRVWTCGATAMGNNRYADESGIIGELALENLYKNREGNPHIWDIILLDKVKNENNIELFLNTYIDTSEVCGSIISSVSGTQASSGKRFDFCADMFIDCTGDGSAGYYSGAAYMAGREGRKEYEESLAPDNADGFTMGNTILFNVKDMGREVRYIPPKFAYTKEYIKGILKKTGKRIEIKKNGCDLWWLEYGGILDTIRDNEIIRDELQKLVYGIWDYVKNSGEFDSSTLTLEWAGSVPGKRESRRLKGKYVLTQNDIVNGKIPEDTVCHGGWPIDLHPESGIYSEEASCAQIPAGIYGIPLRCLYSANVGNLMFAGRNISATHVALASTRVMKTCSVMGQAAGTAAAYAVRKSKQPGSLTQNEIEEIKQLLLKDDCWIPGAINSDAEDKARTAVITASGSRRLESAAVEGKFNLSADLHIVFPPAEDFSSISLLMDCIESTVIHAELYEAAGETDYSPGKLLKSIDMCVDECTGKWVEINTDIKSSGSRSIIVKLESNSRISIYTAKDRCCGVFAVMGNRKMNLLYPCFKLQPGIYCYKPENVINGYSRPYIHPNVWISGNIRKSGAWLQLEFPDITVVNEIILYYNPDFNRDYNNLAPDYYNNGWDAMPESLVKDFSIYAQNLNGEFEKTLEVRDNYTRCVICKIDGIKTKRIRIVLEDTHGSDFAEVFEVRVY